MNEIYIYIDRHMVVFKRILSLLFERVINEVIKMISEQ